MASDGAREVSAFLYPLINCADSEYIELKSIIFYDKCQAFCGCSSVMLASSRSLWMRAIDEVTLAVTPCHHFLLASSCTWLSLGSELRVVSITSVQGCFSSPGRSSMRHIFFFSLIEFDTWKHALCLSQMSAETHSFRRYRSHDCICRWTTGNNCELWFVMLNYVQLIGSGKLSGNTALTLYVF